MVQAQQSRDSQPGLEKEGRAPGRKGGHLAVEWFLPGDRATWQWDGLAVATACPPPHSRGWGGFCSSVPGLQPSPHLIPAAIGCHWTCSSTGSPLKPSAIGVRERGHDSRAAGSSWCCYRAGNIRSLQVQRGGLHLHSLLPTASSPPAIDFSVSQLKSIFSNIESRQDYSEILVNSN